MLNVPRVFRFLTNAPNFYPLKTAENQSSDVFRGYKTATFAKNRLTRTTSVVYIRNFENM